MLDILEHAKSELKRIHIDLDTDKNTYSHQIAQNVYDILEYLSDNNHTQQSIREVMLLLNKLVFNKALTIITDDIDGWDILDDNTLINNRDSRITKDVKSKKVYFNDAYIFYAPYETTPFTCKESKIEIKLPIFPQDLKTKYIQLLIKPSIFPIKWQLKLHLYKKLYEKV